MNGDSPIVYGDGTQTRDFTYIEDIVDANVRLITESAADGETLNIGSTDNIEILTLAKEIRDQLAPELDIGFADRHDADAEHTHADISKANELLNYEPSRTIRDGVEDFVEWYGKNRDWYEPLVRSS
jgi:UDP-glucose 4-epimerase